ncbi:MAG: right-handed parallel beta-helix repeat-containing protein, partial [Anaerolineae bacterium]
VDGNDRAPSSGKHSAGILLRNADATVTGNTVQHMYVDGAQTFGIIAYGDCNPLTISNNDVSGYARGGITANGDLGSLPDPANVLIENNTVTGPGLGVPVTWAPNGIQLGWGATGTIRGNKVTGNGWPGTDWTGSGIIIAGSDDVVVEQNEVTSNETAIAVVGDNYFGSGETADRVIVRQNTVQGNTYGISLQDRVVDAQVLGNTITGQSYDGIDVCNFHSLPPTGTVIHNNTIYGNNAENDPTSGGLWVDDGVASVNAAENWWGDATGPSGVGPGSGDAIIAPAGVVDYEPWWADEGMTSRGWEVNTGESIQDVVNAASAGDTIVVPAGTYDGGIVVNKSVIIKGEPGAVIGPGSDGITVTADDVTIMDITLDGTGGDLGNVGIRVADGVQRLHVEGCEILNWPNDGIHFNGAITGLKVVDNYIHDNGGDGVEFNGTPAGTVQIYGNAFRANTGSGINAVSGSVAAEYNEWGDIGGPTGTNGDGVSGTVDYDPWVFGAVYADVVPDPARVREGENVDVDIKVDTANLYGAQFSLTFDPAKLQVVSTADEGAGYFKGSQACHTTYNNALGTLTFYCSRGGTDAAVSGTGVKLLTITFQAQEIVGTSTTATIDLDAASVRLGAVGGVNIFVDSVTDDTLTILGTTTVSGVVDLQGRDNDAGAVVDPLAGVTYGYDPAPVTTGPWGAYSFSNMTDDTYTFTVEMARYLDASAEVVVSGGTKTLNKVILLGGDVNDDDAIDISDLSSIGGKFGETVNPATTPQDINYDGLVDI